MKIINIGKIGAIQILQQYGAIYEFFILADRKLTINKILRLYG